MTAGGSNVSKARKHGYGAYTHGCRCPVCIEAKAAYQRGLRAAGRGSAPLTHGISGYQNHGCRCAVCVEAKRAATQRQRQARREANMTDTPIFAAVAGDHAPHVEALLTRPGLPSDPAALVAALAADAGGEAGK